jgi:hypothetical protein
VVPWVLDSQFRGVSTDISTASTYAVWIREEEVIISTGTAANELHILLSGKVPGKGWWKPVEACGTTQISWEKP